MQKKNTLYTVNRWNKPLFAQSVDRVNNNIFDGLESSYMPSYMANAGSSAVMLGAQPTKGVKITSDPMFQVNIPDKIDPSKLGIGNASVGKGSFMDSGAAQIGMGTGMNLADNIGRSEEFKRGLWDRLDPVHHLAGGRESAVGNALGDAGVATFKASAQQGNGMGMIVGAGLKIGGGLVNSLFGIKTNEELLKAANASIDANKNYTSNAASFDEMKDGISSMTSTDVYEGGAFSSGKADRKNADLGDRMVSAYLGAVRRQDNNRNNLVDDQVNLGLANYASYGGWLDNDYNVAGDYLTMKQKGNKQSNMKNLFVNTPSNMFDLGGDIQMHGGDFKLGHIYEVTEKEANRLKARGYEFRIIG